MYVGKTQRLHSITCASASNSIYSPLHFLAPDGWLTELGRERKINSSRSNPRAWSITHCSPQWAWCRAAARGGKSKEANTPRLRGEIAVGRPAPHWVIAHLSPAWNVRGNSCPSSKIQSAECSSGRLMDVSAGRAISEKGGKWMGPIALDGIMCDCYPSQVWYKDDGQGL